MWRASTSNKAKKQQQQQQPNGLLSLSLLGNATSAWHSNVTALTPNTQHQQQSWTPRTGRTGATTGSASCSGRDDTALHELLSQHEQILQALGGRVVELQDKLEQLHEDVGPALRLVAAVREAAMKQQLQDTGNRDQELPDSPTRQRKDQQPVDLAAAAAAAATTTACNVSGTMADTKTAAAQHHTVPTAEAFCRMLADLAGLSTPTAAKQQGDQQQLPGSVLGRDQAAAGGLRYDRDDCGSVQSFATSISFASTAVSGPALMYDLRPAGKGPSRAPQQLQQHSAPAAVPGLNLPSCSLVGRDNAAASAAAAAAGANGGCSSWPLQAGLEEECSAEEIQQTMELVTGQQQQQADGTDPSKQPEQQQQQLCDALSCLALHAECDEDVRQQLCSSPLLLQRLMQLLLSPEVHTAQLAAHLVWYISRSEGLRSLLQQQEQLLAALLGLLAGQDVAAARAAAFALNNCAHEASFRFAMLEAGAVPCLVEMLSGCDALGQEAAAAALMNLASEERNIRSAIVACNGIQALVVVLKYGGPAAQEAAAAAIENLSLDSDCEAALAAEGAIEGLLQVLKDGSTAAQAAAAGALRNLAVNEELEEQLLAAGCVAVLLQLAARPQEDVGVRTAALEGLRNLAASSTRSGDALVQAGGAAVVVDAARSLPAAAARSAALGTLLVLSMDATHRQAITAAGAASVLVHAALSGSLLAKEYAARSLANLAATEAARTELLSEGAATVLAALLKAQLAQLTGGKAAGAAAEQGGVAASASCVLAAARALQNLSKSKLGCRLLLDAGCIAPLAAALALPGATATAAASALCSLCSSRRVLQELADCSGCSRLVAAAAQPKWLTPRGQRNAVRLLRRLVRAVGSCRADVQEQLAAAGLKLHLV